MEIIKQAAMYFLGFKPYVMLPVIIFILALVFRIRLRTAITSAFTIGIGFIGIFIVFDYFVAIINPVIQALIKRTGLHLNILDAGWPPLAAITWSFGFAPLFIILVMAVNIILLVTKLTKTVNIDIWNYWHFIFTGALVYNVTQNIFFSSLATILICVITLKIADWSAPMVNKFSGMDGISIPTLSAATYFPFGVLGNRLIDKIPFINKIEANPEKMKEKVGLAGEPMIIGFVIGILLGLGGGYDTKKIAEVAIGIAAVIYILPKMANIVGSSLIPISEGMKEFIKRRFPGIGGTYIALDVAVLVGIPSVVVTAILLMPIALILSFTLPGIKFIPLGDLVNIMGSVALVCTATRGNVIRSFLIGIPIVVIHLYTASNMASMYTKLAGSVNYKFENYSGTFTSFLDGGNVIRVWLVKLFAGNTYAVLLIPIFILIFYFTRKISRKG
jgi:PTS system galactitol-specific IIC component